MEMDRQELFKKRNVVRNALRTLAFDMNLDLYFADRQHYDEIKAVFVRNDEAYRIICKLNEMADICKAINTVREYLSTIPGRTLAGSYIVESKDESSIYPSVMNSFKFDVDYADRLRKRMLNYQYGYKPITPSYFKIEKVIFNDPATIVIWADGSKTVVKCQPGDTFDKEKGLAMAISKRALGDKGRYCEEFKKWIPAVEEEVKTELEPAIVNPYEDDDEDYNFEGEVVAEFTINQRTDVLINVDLEKFRWSLVGDGYIREEAAEMSQEELINVFKERINAHINAEYDKTVRLGLLDDNEDDDDER